MYVNEHEYLIMTNRYRVTHNSSRDCLRKIYNLIGGKKIQICPEKILHTDRIA